MSQLEQKQADEILDLIDEKIELRRMLERVLAVTRAYLAENEHTGTVADDAGNVHDHRNSLFRTSQHRQYDYIGIPDQPQALGGRKIRYCERFFIGQDTLIQRGLNDFAVRVMHPHFPFFDGFQFFGKRFRDRNLDAFRPFTAQILHRHNEPLDFRLLGIGWQRSNTEEER